MAMLDGIELYFEHISDEHTDQAEALRPRASTTGKLINRALMYQPFSHPDDSDSTTRYVALIPGRTFQIVFRVLRSSPFYFKGDFKLRITFDRGATVENAEVYISKVAYEGAMRLRPHQDWREIKLTRIFHQANKLKSESSRMSTELLSAPSVACNVIPKSPDTGEIKIEVHIGTITLLSEAAPKRLLQNKCAQAQTRASTAFLHKQGIFSEIVLSDPLQMEPQRLHFQFSPQENKFLTFSFHYRTPLRFLLYKLGESMCRQAGENPQPIQSLIGFAPAKCTLVTESLISKAQCASVSKSNQKDNTDLLSLTSTRFIANSQQESTDLTDQQLDMIERINCAEVAMILSKTEKLERELEDIKVEQQKLTEGCKRDLADLQEQRGTQDKAHKAMVAELEAQKRDLIERYEGEKERGLACVSALQEDILKLEKDIAFQETECTRMKQDLLENIKQSRVRHSAAEKDYELTKRTADFAKARLKQIEEQMRARKRPRTASHGIAQPDTQDLEA